MGFQVSGLQLEGPGFRGFEARSLGPRVCGFRGSQDFCAQ